MQKRKENKNSIQIQFQQAENTNTRKIEENNLIPQCYKKMFSILMTLIRMLNIPHLNESLTKMTIKCIKTEILTKTIYRGNINYY